jgi:murein DD-endopeptidase MepM/ murein hydrolase activator NlpD
MKIRDRWNWLRSNPIKEVIKHKHRFVVMDTDTFKEKFSFQLSGINLFVAVGISIILLVLLTIVLIAFTPLREWIPGYTNTQMVEQSYENVRRVDSLETRLAEQEWMIGTLQAVLREENPGGEFEAVSHDSTTTLTQLTKVYRHTVEDSLLRAEVEREDNRYQVKGERKKVKGETLLSSSQEGTVAVAHLFFAPMKGKIMSPFEKGSQRAGIDIAGTPGQVVYAAYNGTVISANFTSEEGYVIAIQHPGNVVSLYRNNGVLLKHRGDVVRAGEPIAYVATPDKGDATPYLHFELWVNGVPVNPEEYISF